MRKLLYLLGCSILILRLNAGSMITDVKPGKPDVSGFRIEVQSQPLPSGRMHFIISVSETTAKFCRATKPGFSISVKTVEEEPNGGIRSSINPVVELKPIKRGASMVCEFDVEVRTDESFVFHNGADAMFNGKLTAMPSADFYCVKLKDFMPAGKP